MQAIWSGKTPKLGKIKLKGMLGSLGKKDGFGLMGRTTDDGPRSPPREKRRLMDVEASFWLK